jgi:hypothetical protein
VVLQVLTAPSGVKEIPDPQSVDAGLRDAREHIESMRLLGGHVTSMAAAAKDGPKDLDTAYNFQTTYLQPLRVFNTVIENLANVWATLLCWKRADQVAYVHPYAKMVLGMLSAASKVREVSPSCSAVVDSVQIILAQTERDQSVQSLVEKLEEVYRFMSQNDTLGQILFKRSVAGRIAQQTLECAHFIRDYSERKGFCKSSNYRTSHIVDLILLSQ